MAVVSSCAEALRGICLEADYVVVMDPWWSPAAEEQAAGRAHRIGQQRPVTVYRLVNRGTLEERIVALHRDKRALADSVLGEQRGMAVLPSTQDLLDLLRERAPARLALYFSTREFVRHTPR